MIEATIPPFFDEIMFLASNRVCLHRYCSTRQTDKHLVTDLLRDHPFENTEGSEVSVNTLNTPITIRCRARSQESRTNLSRTKLFSIQTADMHRRRTIAVFIIDRNNSFFSVQRWDILYNHRHLGLNSHTYAANRA